MDLRSRLQRLIELAGTANVHVNPALRPETIADRTGRAGVELPAEVRALLSVCDGAVVEPGTRVVSLADYLDHYGALRDFAAEADEEEWQREYFPLAEDNGLLLCLDAGSRALVTIDLESIWMFPVAPDLDRFLAALEHALAHGGIRPDEDGLPALAGWDRAREQFGVGAVWTSEE